MVLDVMMPGMSGWEVCRKIRQDASFAHTGVLMLTGIGPSSKRRRRARLFGADEFIDKPFDFDKLDEKIASVLEHRASRREAVPRPLARVRLGRDRQWRWWSWRAQHPNGSGHERRRNARRQWQEDGSAPELAT